jgi:hypothetical protein
VTEVKMSCSIGPDMPTGQQDINRTSRHYSGGRPWTSTPNLREQGN